MGTGSRRRLATVAAGSVLFHALVIGLLVQTFQIPAPPRLERGATETIVPVIIARRQARPPPAASLRPRPRAVRSPRIDTPVAPLGLAPAPAAPPVEPPGPRDLQPDARQALRTSLFGCSQADLVGLTLRERERCNEKLGEKYKDMPGAGGSARTAVALSDIPPDKRAYYDAVLASKHGPGRGPGVVCGPRDRKGKGPPHSLKLGPLPCYVLPPVGPLTPGADVPEPD